MAKALIAISRGRSRACEMPQAFQPNKQGDIDITAMPIIVTRAEQIASPRANWLHRYQMPDIGADTNDAGSVAAPSTSGIDRARRLSSVLKWPPPPLSSTAIHEAACPGPPIVPGIDATRSHEAIMRDIKRRAEDGDGFSPDERRPLSRHRVPSRESTSAIRLIAAISKADKI